MCILSQFLIHAKSQRLGVCTSVRSFILSFICYLLDLHPGVGTLKVLSLQQSIEDRYSALVVHMLWFFPYSLKMSLVFSIF